MREKILAMSWGCHIEAFFGGVGKISTEIIGDHLYFLREEGFDMTPEGMARLFNLIERVDKIDPPRQLV